MARRGRKSRSRSRRRKKVGLGIEHAPEQELSSGQQIPREGLKRKHSVDALAESNKKNIKNRNCVISSGTARKEVHGTTKRTFEDKFSEEAESTRKKVIKRYVVASSNKFVSKQVETNSPLQKHDASSLSELLDSTPPIKLKYSKRSKMTPKKSEYTTSDLSNNQEHSSNPVSQVTEFSCITCKTTSSEPSNKRIVCKDNVEASINANGVLQTCDEKSSKNGDADSAKKSGLIFEDDSTFDVLKKRSLNKHYQRRRKGKDRLSAISFSTCLPVQDAQGSTIEKGFSLSHNANMSSCTTLSSEASLRDNLVSQNACLDASGNSSKSNVPSETNPAPEVVKNYGSVRPKRSKHKAKKRIPELMVDKVDVSSNITENKLMKNNCQSCCSKEDTDYPPLPVLQNGVVDKDSALSANTNMGSFMKASNGASHGNALLSLVKKVHYDAVEASSNSDKNEVSLETSKGPEIVNNRLVRYKRSGRKGKKNSFLLKVDLKDNISDTMDNNLKNAVASGIFHDSEEVERTIREEKNLNNSTVQMKEGWLGYFPKASQCKDLYADRNRKVLYSGSKEGVSLPASPVRNVLEDFGSLHLCTKQKNQLESCNQGCVENDVKFVMESSIDLSLDLCESGRNLTMCCCESKTVDCEYELTETMNDHEKEKYSSISHVVKDVSSEVIEGEEKKLNLVKLTVLSHRRKKLLVLDLNGLLVDIIQDYRNADKSHKRVGGKTVFKRPFCDEFLQFCFEKFDIGVWSSRKKYNLDSVVDYLMGNLKYKLLFCWDQSKCTDTGRKTVENMHKPLVLKELKKLWNKEENDLPWEEGEYSPSNTLLVDDSPYKAICNPPHTAIFPYPYYFDDKDDNSLGPGGDLRCYLEGLVIADDVQHYVRGHPFGQNAISETDPFWKFYLQIIESIQKSSASTS